METDESASPVPVHHTAAKPGSDKRLLIEKLQKTHNLTLEATFLSSWQSFGMKFEASLAVPAYNFDPQQKGQIRCEPVVLCQEENGRTRIISTDEFETALMDVREASTCEDWSKKVLFDKSRPSPVLLGVANLSLAPLAYDIRFTYVAPVFGTQGEIAARIHCEIRRILVPDSSSCEIRIREVNELPEEFNQFVFCQYRFPGEDEPSYALPAKQFQHLCAPGAVPFNHSMTFNLHDESVFSTVLPIEVWGHPRHLRPLRRDNSLLVKQIGDKWRSFKCLLMLSVGIKELGDSGIWHSVQSSQDPRVAGCAGYYKIRQGHSHIITVKVRPIRTPGSLPVSVGEISKVEVGCVHCCKGPISNQLDSYHEEDLIMLRDMWLKALDERKLLLQQQIEASNGSEEKEKKLIDRLVNLTEERNLVELPPAGSGIPGSPADWTPPPGLEKHSPLLLLLDRNCIDIPISEERQDEFLTLRFLPRCGEASRTSTQVQCHWDPTSHESAWLNQVSDPDVFVFLIVRAHVHLKAGSNGNNDERTVILRKRVPVQITRRSSGTWFSKLLPALQHGSGRTDETGVIFEVVSHLPQAIFQVEPRDQLATSAAQSVSDSNGTTNLLDQYLAQIGELDELLLDDQQRQGMILTEALAHAGRKTSDTIPLPEREEVVESEIKQADSIYFDAQSEKMQEDELWQNDSYCRPTSPTDSEKTLKVECASISTVMTDATLNAEDLSKPVPVQLSQTECHILESQAQRSLSLPDWLAAGQRVIVCTNSVNRKPGVVRYIGPTAIKKGIWIGVELDGAHGKNDGSYRGNQYFVCQPDHGVFVRPDKLVKEK